MNYVSPVLRNTLELKMNSSSSNFSSKMEFISEIEGQRIQNFQIEQSDEFTCQVIGGACFFELLDSKVPDLVKFVSSHGYGRINSGISSSMFFQLGGGRNLPF